MNILLQELMRNLKITFEENQTNIKFNNYYFNGIQTPKDIEFKDISTNNLKIFWNIDNINILNIDNKKINFIVEMRKENKNEKFIKVYEGNNKNCLIDNLIKNTNYEIRICSKYNELIGIWSKIKKVKTIEIDSIILKDQKEKKNF